MFTTVIDLRDLEGFPKDFLKGEKAVTGAMRGAAQTLKHAWRGEVVAAGLGVRLGNSMRGQHYPQSGESMNAAALVWTKAPTIIAAHQSGPLIRARNARWLAIPTEAAGRARGGGRITPDGWQRARGIRLRFVALRSGRSAILVADDARINARGLAMANRRRRRRDGILTGAQTVPIFVLVRQVKLPKRLDLLGAAERVASALPGAIRAGWTD